MNTEPVMTREYIQSIVTAAVAILVAFEVWTPTDEQVVAILTAVAVLYPLLGFWVRSKVTPTANLPDLPPPPVEG